MSTNIPNALRFNEGVDLGDACRAVMGLRDIVYLMQRAHLIKMFANVATQTWVRKHRFGHQTSTPLCAAYEAYNAQLAKTDKFKDYTYRRWDNSATMVLFDVEGIVLALLQSNKAEGYYPHLLKHLPASEYSYWDNTDKPKRITRKPWAERERLWNAALPGAGVPSEAGIQIKISRTVYDLPNAKEVRHAMGRRADIIEFHARKHVQDDRMAAYMAAGGNTTVTRALRGKSLTQNWLDSKESHQAFADEMTILEKRLPKLTQQSIE